jgi:hypothetical protein
VRAWVGAALVGPLALGALLSTAFHATTTTSHLGSAALTREADYSNGYYDCLAAEGRRLLRPSDTAFVGQANLGSWVTITKAVGGWTRMTERRSQATVALLLVDAPARQRRQQPTCDGQYLLSIRVNGAGHVVMARAGAAVGP